MAHPTRWPPCPSCGEEMTRSDSATLEERPGYRVAGLTLLCPSCGSRWAATQTVVVAIESVAVKSTVCGIAPVRAGNE